MNSGLTLTSVREHPRKAGHFQLQLSDGRRYVLGEEGVLELGLIREGVQVSDVALARLEHESAVYALMQRALASLARARRTHRELEIRLRRRTPDTALVREALERLAARGLLQDEQVAQAEAASRFRRGQGPALVRRALRQKGLPRGVADEAVNRVVVDEAYDELETCRHQATRRLRTLASVNHAVARRRLSGYLQRRGFSASAIRTIVHELLANRDT